MVYSPCEIIQVYLSPPSLGSFNSTLVARSVRSVRVNGLVKIDDENYHRYHVTGARERDRRFHATSLGRRG